MKTYFVDEKWFDEYLEKPINQKETQEKLIKILNN